MRARRVGSQDASVEILRAQTARAQDDSVHFVKTSVEVGSKPALLTTKGAAPGEDCAVFEEGSLRSATRRAKTAREEKAESLRSG